MISETLRLARQYEETVEKEKPELERPSFHLTPRVGWMNDPNGFSFSNGKYNLFYQYHPYKPHWGPMHWGHAVSMDLIKWEHSPVALAPDKIYDRLGCFSGTAETLDDGRHLLMYTGVSGFTVDGVKKEAQTQCVAVWNGDNYEKYQGNPVIDSDMVPENGSTVDFRDPKIFKKKDGSFGCLIANRTLDGSSQLLLYKSQDGFKWAYDKVLISNNHRLGKMWECPDIFELGDKWVVLISPQDCIASDYEYDNGNITVGIIGDFDETNSLFQEDDIQALDYGLDFYASQTTQAPDGRRILIGWMQNWDTLSIIEHKDWFGQMSIPRELTMKNNRLYQKPIREIEKYRSNYVGYHDVEVANELTLDNIEGRQVDMTVSIKDFAKLDLFEMRLAQDSICRTVLRFDPKDQTMELDRRKSGSRRAIAHSRKIKLKTISDEVNVRLIMDKYSIEAFINDGEQVMTMTIYTDLNAKGISFFVDGETLISVDKYDLVV